MELTKQAYNFLKNHFGIIPEQIILDNPDGTKSICYLLPSKNGMQPMRIDQVENYCKWMLGNG
jgi:hypothetical protein